MVVAQIRGLQDEYHTLRFRYVISAIVFSSLLRVSGAVWVPVVPRKRGKDKEEEKKKTSMLEGIERHRKEQEGNRLTLPPKPTDAFFIADPGFRRERRLFSASCSNVWMPVISPASKRRRVFV